MWKISQKNRFSNIFFRIFQVPGSYLLCIPSFAAMGNGELVLRCTCVLDVTAAILDVTFSVIVHALAFRLLWAASICSLLSVCDCSYSKLLLSKRAFLSLLSRHKYASEAFVLFPSTRCLGTCGWPSESPSSDRLGTAFLRGQPRWSTRQQEKEDLLVLQRSDKTGK